MRTNPVFTLCYAYNGLGQRVRKFSSTGATSTVIFVHGQSGELLGEYSNTGAALREYVWLGTTPIAMFTPPTSGSTPVVFYLHADHLDTPCIATDTVRWRWLSEPFGTTAPEDNPSSLGAITQPLRMPGQYADSESGLFYNYFRNLDPTLGRYSSSDPIGLAGGVNTYTYVKGNPLSRINPMGLQSLGDDRPSRPGPGVWDPVPGANRNIALQLERMLTEICKPDCAALEAEIRLVADELRARYFPLLGDTRDLYNTAYIRRISWRGGSYVGHQQQFRDKQNRVEEKD